MESKNSNIYSDHDVVRITKAEQIALCRLKEQGDAQARDKLIRSIIPYAASLAHRFRCPFGVSRDDMIQAAFLGAIEAVDHYDSSQGFALTTMATMWIKRRIILEQRLYSVVRIGSSAQKYAEDHPERLELNMRCANARAGALSLADMDDATLCEHSYTPDVEGSISAADERQMELSMIQEAMRSLTDREQLAVLARYNGEILEDIGRDIGVTRERVRQIALKAHEKIRNEITKREYTHGRHSTNGKRLSG